MVATGQENGQANLNYFMVRETRERLFWVTLGTFEQYL